MDKNTFYITTEVVSIDEMRVIPWKVGKYRKDLLSRGIRFSFELPIIEDKDLEQLYNQKGIDAWLIKLNRKQGLHNDTLGYYSMLLVSPNPRNQSDLRFSSPKKGSIGINYAASSISMRLDEQPCPALNHRLLIEDYELKKENSPRQQWVVSGADDFYVSAKVTMISYSPITVNGGMELKGDYSLEIAFYNQRQKRRVSPFIPLYKVASVAKETEMAIKGCENFITPDKEKEGVIDKFKFGR